MRCNILVLLLFCCFVLPAWGKIKLTTQVSGIHGAMKTNVVKQLEQHQTNIIAPLNADKIRAFSKQLPEIIAEATQAYGYFQPQIKSKLVRNGENWTIKIHINPQKPLKISQLKIEITGPCQHDPVYTDLLNRIKLRQGSILVTEQYDKLKEAFYNVAQLNGNLQAKFTTHEIKVDLKKYTAEVTLVFNTGPQFYFGQIVFSRSPFAQSFLRRFLPFKAGDKYDPKKLAQLERDLGGTVYFSQVRVKPLLNKTKKTRVPVKVHLLPHKPQQYNFGIGFGTDTLFRGSFGWTWRHITDTGQYLQGLIQVSQKLFRGSAAQVQYIIPGEHPATDHYSINGGILFNQVGEQRYTTTQAGISKVQALAYGWQQTMALNYQHELSQSTKQRRTRNTILPSIGWSKTQADDIINTNNGYKLSLLLQGGIPTDGKNNFLQTTFNGKYIKSFFASHSRIILRTNLGYTLVKDPDQLPLSQSFTAGGANSVRGYRYNRFGPGRILMVFSGEYQMQIYGNFYLAGFYDAGNAFNNFPANLNQAVGTGLVYRSPIGPIEVSIARALNPFGSKFKDRYRLQFSMGPDL
ncbi:MAG: BamA/TamA family outer membrane protein [Pseudomonadota bacterium]